MRNSNIAIIIFTYSRLDHTKTTLEYLSKNKGFPSYPVLIFSDSPKEKDKKQVEEVRKYLREFSSKHKNINIIEREKNYGLTKSIVSGVTDVFKKYKSAIVIEDDIKTSPMFLRFISKMLLEYENKKGIASISGYSHSSKMMKIPKEYKYDIYFIPRTSSWGWATWKDRWEGVDWEIKNIESFIKEKEIQKEFNKAGNDLSRMLINQVKKNIDTWDIQWSYHNFKKNRLTVYPVLSYVDNIGHDGTGIHCGKTSGFKNTVLNLKEVKSIPNKIEIDNLILRNFKKVYNLTPRIYAELIIDRLLKIVKRILYKK